MIQTDTNVYSQRLFRYRIGVFKPDFQKLLINSLITTILVVVDNNSCLVSLSSETREKSCFCESLLGKRPSHLALEGNCLQLFLARVWQLTISRYQFAKNF